LPHRREKVLATKRKGPFAAEKRPEGRGHGKRFGKKGEREKTTARARALNAWHLPKRRKREGKGTSSCLA